MELWIQPKWAKTEEAKKEPEDVTKRRKEDNLPQPVPVVAMTHRAKASALDAALEEIRASGVIGEDPVKLRML